MRQAVVVGLISFAALAGCTHVQPGSSTAAAPAAQVVVAPDAQPAPRDSPSPEDAAGPAASPSASAGEPPPAVMPDRSQPAPVPSSVADKPAATAAPGPVPAGKAGTTAAANVARPATTVAQPVAPLASKQTTASAAAPPVAAPVAAVAQPPPPSLDLTSLEQRLRDTRAIGLFTKLSLKNQVDELLSQFRAYHGGDKTTPPNVLRQRYDGLVLKVLSVLQDGDPPLAAQIWSSREAIWGILADPAKFAKI
jgi:hypothetical protein